MRRRLSSALLLAAVAALVGLLIGTVGVGGVLMVSFLALFGGLTIHEAAATSPRGAAPAPERRAIDRMIVKYRDPALSAAATRNESLRNNPDCV